ncbi:MAG TPA: DciA family protein [Phycisphaerales bacterium]|nr:DciA family protein [Phycisphaerales bacterium]HMP38257.1 DciA family protein [Phycisphaerales bacterium]
MAGWRSRPDAARPIAEELAAVVRKLRAEGRRRGSFTDAWTALVSPELGLRCRATELRNGSLTVVADDASTAWALDRALREGLEVALRQATGGAVQRVRVRVGRRDEAQPDRLAPNSRPGGPSSLHPVRPDPVRRGEAPRSPAQGEQRGRKRRRPSS